MRNSINRLTPLPLVLAVCVVGCTSHYAVPGPAANMAVFGVMSQQERHNATDWHIRGALERKPLAAFPTGLAMARVQGSGFRSYTCDNAYGYGAYSVVTAHDVETKEHIEKLEALPMVSGVARMSRLLLPRKLTSDEQLRRAAACLHADMLLIYTFDTNIYRGDTTSPLDLVTLGLLPNGRVKVTSTVSAALLDTRNGYIYGLAEGTASHRQLANTWTTERAVDQSRLRADREAFEKMLDEFGRTWKGVVETYASTGPRQASQSAAAQRRMIVVQGWNDQPSTTPPGARYRTSTRE